MGSIYTRTGDEGTTYLPSAGRVAKSHPRIEALGALDELTSHLGMARAAIDDEEILGVLRQIQALLLELGADLSSAEALGRITDADVRWLEETIDLASDECPPLAGFIMPCGGEGACRLHLARAVCRCAERRLVEAAVAQPVGGEALRFVNRLSDALFALARLVECRDGGGDDCWEPRGHGSQES